MHLIFVPAKAARAWIVPGHVQQSGQPLGRLDAGLCACDHAHDGRESLQICPNVLDAAWTTDDEVLLEIAGPKGGKEVGWDV